MHLANNSQGNSFPKDSKHCPGSYDGQPDKSPSPEYLNIVLFNSLAYILEEDNTIGKKQSC